MPLCFEMGTGNGLFARSCLDCFRAVSEPEGRDF
jgi:hypothetical protein